MCIFQCGACLPYRILVPFWHGFSGVCRTWQGVPVTVHREGGLHHLWGLQLGSHHCTVKHAHRHDDKVL